MARRQTKARGDRPEDLTPSDYARAWELFSTGHDARTIKRVVALSGAQFHALYTVGLKARGGRRKSLPGFEKRLAEETAAIRTEAVQAAKEVSTRGVRVLEGALRNSETAQVMVAGIQRLVADKIDEAMRMPVGKRPSLESLMPGPQTIATLRTLRQVADGYERAARAYDLIYRKPGEVHPAGRAVMDVPNQGRRIVGGPDRGAAALPAALAMADELAGEGTSDALMEEVGREIMRWTSEQQEHYALTGEEPHPNDVIDVTATTR